MIFFQISEVSPRTSSGWEVVGSKIIVNNCRVAQPHSQSTTQLSPLVALFHFIFNLRRETKKHPVDLLIKIGSNIHLVCFIYCLYRAVRSLRMSFFRSGVNETTWRKQQTTTNNKAKKIENKTKIHNFVARWNFCNNLLCFVNNLLVLFRVIVCWCCCCCCGYCHLGNTLVCLENVITIHYFNQNTIPHTRSVRWLVLVPLPVPVLAFTSIINYYYVAVIEVNDAKLWEKRRISFGLGQPVCLS